MDGLIQTKEKPEVRDKKHQDRFLVNDPRPETRQQRKRKRSVGFKFQNGGKINTTHFPRIFFRWSFSW